MFISIVIPVYNAEKYVDKCIQGFLRQNYPRDKFEVIMVDNNSGDRSTQIIKQYPDITLLHEPKQGAYAARNKGIGHAKGDIFAFTDPDCIPDTDWLPVIARAMASPDIDILLGSHRLGKTIRFLSLMSDYGNERSRYVFSSNIRELYYGYTNNMVVRTNIFKETGGFVERKRGADTIFVQRYLETHSCSGIRYHPGMKIRHMEISKLSDLYRKFSIYARSRKAYSHIAYVRTLTARERLKIFLKTIRKNHYSFMETVISFCLLVVGLFFWYWGQMTMRVRRDR